MELQEIFLCIKKQFQKLNFSFHTAWFGFKSPQSTPTLSRSRRRGTAIVDAPEGILVVSVPSTFNFKYLQDENYYSKRVILLIGGNPCSHLNLTIWA